MLVEARVPVTLCTNGSTTLPACRRCSASRSPEYSSEEEEVDEEEEEEEDEEDEDGEDAGGSGGIQTREDIKNELSNMSFEDIMKLQNKVGTKVYNEVAYGSSKSGESRKKKRLNKNR